MSGIERIRSEHVQDGDPGDPHCAMCSDASYPIWPCDAAILLALLAERDAEIARLKLTTRSDREYAEQKQRAEEAEAEIARLVAAGQAYIDAYDAALKSLPHDVRAEEWCHTERYNLRAALAARGGEVKGA